CTMRMTPRWRYTLHIAAVAAAYFAAARIGLLAAVAQTAVSSAWPPSGVALAALLLPGLRCWPGIALGAFLLNWTAGVPAGRAAGRRLDAAGLLAALLLLTALLLRNPLAYVYAVFPVVIWAALRFGSRGAATATAVVATLTIWYTLHGLGPFVASTPTENLALLQTFLGLTAVTGLVLAAVVTERGAAGGALGREVAFVELLQAVAVAANEAPTAEHAL